MNQTEKILGTGRKDCSGSRDVVFSRALSIAFYQLELLACFRSHKIRSGLNSVHSCQNLIKPLGASILASVQIFRESNLKLKFFLSASEWNQRATQTWRPSSSASTTTRAARCPWTSCARHSRARASLRLRPRCASHTHAHATCPSMLISNRL